MIARLATCVLVLVSCGQSPAPTASNHAPAPACDAPAVIMYEHNPSLWLDGAPTIAIWPDGAVAFTHEGPRAALMHGRIAVATARALVAHTADRIRPLDRYIHVLDASEQPWIDLVVRDGETWRAVQVWGVTRSAGADSLSPSDTEGARSIPPNFQDAFRELLGARPATGTPGAHYCGEETIFRVLNPKDYP